MSVSQKLFSDLHMHGVASTGLVYTHLHTLIPTTHTSRSSSATVGCMKSFWVWRQILLTRVKLVPASKASRSSLLDS